jgi:N-acetylmuramoyl-L-alanine amidase
MPIQKTVSQGECLVSIASEQGHLWETIWNHPENAALKRQRKDPNVLLPGDELHIPDKTTKTQSCGTDRRHRFKLRGTPARVRLKLTGRPKSEDQPAESTESGPGMYKELEPEAVTPESLARVPYRLYVDDVLVAEKKTDGDGRIDEVIPAGSREAYLVLDPDTPKERTLSLQLGHMDPLDEVVGVCKRLRNLGYDCPTEEQAMTPQISEALAKFQREQGLTPTGEADEKTRARLKELHGG